MDLLSEESGINLSEKDWKIYARNTAEPPHYIGTRAKIKKSIISEGCNIDGFIQNSIISTGVDVCEGAEIYDSVIMPNAVIEKGAVIRHSIVGWKAHIGRDAKIGAFQQAPESGEWKIAVVGPHTAVKENSVINAGEMVGGNKYE